MFCGECGTKNDKDARFCESCGAILEEKKEKNKSVKKKKENDNVICCPKCDKKNTFDSVFCENCGSILKEEKINLSRKHLTKKNKIIICACFIILVLLFSVYKVLDIITSPKAVAKEYIEAIINKDSNKLYNYIDISGDTTFISKDIFKNIVDEEYKDITIENYTIKDTNYSDGKLNATVRFTYTTKEYPQEQDGTINLVKNKGKRYLLFDSWKISSLNTNVSIIDNYKIEVPKDATLKYGNIEVEKKYLTDSKSKTDIYTLPKVFESSTLVEVVLNNGITLVKDALPSKYRNEIEINISKDTIKEEEKEKIVSFVKDELTILYQNAIDDTKWDSIKDRFKDFSKEFKENYEDFSQNIKGNYRPLKSITLKNGTLSDISFTDDGKLKVEIKFNYDYTLEYKSLNGDVKNTNKSNYSYMTVILERGKDGYSLYDIKNLQTSFYS